MSKRLNFRCKFSAVLEEFRKYLIDDCSTRESDRYLVTVSGGVDSVVMASLFNAAKLNFGIAHCNFRLRGEESDGDEQFVAALAASMNVPFYRREFDTEKYAREQGISIQMAARDLRYSWFHEAAATHKYNYIATGHNKNDIVETMLLNLSRGTGLRGLMGIRARHDKLVRPLLFASRQRIVEYARENNLEWREDSSNEETKYNRNKVRHTIIPAFESINPAFVQNALETSIRIEHTGKLLDLILEQIKKEVWSESNGRITININKLKKYPSTDILLFELLRDFGVTQLSSEMLVHTLETSTGKQFHTRSHTITRDRDFLIVTQNLPELASEVLIGPDTARIEYPVRLCFTITGKEDFNIPVSRNTAAIDADKIRYPLMLREWRNGDRFQPFGMNGTKKVSDFLINIKLPLPDKRNVRVLESDGKIVWIVNHRIDERFKITEETKRVLLIEYEEKPEMLNGNL